MIRFENVAKVYDAKSTPALDDVSLDIERGEFVYLVGASGSGKSTFLQLVLREHKATEGKVLVAGKDVAALSSWKVPHLRRQMGAVFQDFRLLPNKTVYENVAFALEVLGRSRSQIAKTVPQTLEMVGLAGKERRLPHELSGGEQQRVAIARAFVNRPAILLADEPTGNLDPKTSRGIMNVLDRINATGTTIVMATHDVALVDEIRRRVIELADGKIVRDEMGGTYVTTSIPVIRLDDDEVPDEAPEQVAASVDSAEQAADQGAASEAEPSDSRPAQSAPTSRRELREQRAREAQALAQTQAPAEVAQPVEPEPVPEAEYEYERPGESLLLEPITDADPEPMVSAEPEALAEPEAPVEDEAEPRRRRLLFRRR